MSRLVDKIEYKQNGAFVSERKFDEPVSVAEAQRHESEDKNYLKSSAPHFWSKGQKTVTSYFGYVEPVAQ